MAQRTVCFRSDAGNDFADEFDALRDDLRHYIVSVIKNEPLAVELTDRIVSDLLPTGVMYLDGKEDPARAGFSDLINGLVRTHRSTPPQLDLGPVRSEYLQGPGIPVHPSAPVMPIPPFVYFNAVMDKFFDAMNKVGIGSNSEFHEIWYPRRTEFPTDKHRALAPRAPQPVAT